MKSLRTFLAFIICFSFVAISVNTADAIPAFAKKYSEQCNYCHNTWPQLNRWGEDFKMNGYQAPKTADGATRGKNEVADNAFLDTGDANLPYAVRLRARYTLSRDTKTKASGAKDSRRSFLPEADVEAVLFGGGSFNKNVGYFAELPFGGGVEVATLSFNNLGGPGMANIEVGISNLNQYSVITYHRNQLMRGKIIDGGGLIAHSAPTIQVYGNPNRGSFTYSLGVNDNSGDMDKDIAIGLGLRYDYRPANFAVSYNYVGGNSHRETSGMATVWDTPAAGFDESSATNGANAYGSHAIAAKYEGDPVLARLWFGLASQDNVAYAPTGTKVKLDAVGYGFDVWYLAEKFEVGAGLDLYSEKLSEDAATFCSGCDKDKRDWTMVSVEAYYLAAANAKIGLWLNSGGWDNDYLEDSGNYTNNQIRIVTDIAF